jgi:hypothetical protein
MHTPVGCELWLHLGISIWILHVITHSGSTKENFYLPARPCYKIGIVMSSESEWDFLCCCRYAKDFFLMECHVAFLRDIIYEILIEMENIAKKILLNSFSKFFKLWTFIFEIFETQMQFFEKFNEFFQKCK